MDTVLENTPKRRLPLLVLGVFLLTIIAVVLRTVNLFLFYDAKIEYFSVGEPLPLIMNIFLAVASVAIAVGAFVFSKERYVADGTEKGIALKIASLICALASLFPFYVIVKNVLTLPYLQPSVITLAFLVIFALSAIYFAMNFISKTLKAQAIFVIAVILSLTYFLANSYFDLYTPMNSPAKTIMHLACVSSMIFFVSEARCIIGEAKRRFYVFALSAAVFFSGVSSIPSIISFACKKLDYNYIAFDVVILAVFIYLSVRLVYLITAKEKTVANTTEEDSISSDISDENSSEEASENEAIVEEDDIATITTEEEND